MIHTMTVADLHQRLRRGEKVVVSDETPDLELRRELAVLIATPCIGHRPFHGNATELWLKEIGE